MNTTTDDSLAQREYAVRMAVCCAFDIAKALPESKYSRDLKALLQTWLDYATRCDASLGQELHEALEAVIGREST